MITRRHTIIAPCEPGAAVRFMADFGARMTWDPTVRSSKRLDAGPVREGMAYEVITGDSGDVEIRYVLAQYQPGQHIVMQGTAASMRIVEDIRFEGAPGGGTRVTWQSEIQLLGVRRVVEGLYRGAVERAGERSIEGLRDALRRIERNSGAFRAAGASGGFRRVKNADLVDTGEHDDRMGGEVRGADVTSTADPGDATPTAPR